MKTTSFKQLVNDNIVVVVLIALVVAFAIGSPTFLNTANIINLFGQMCLNAILATGLTYVILLGGIDISVGSTMAVTGILAALAIKNMGVANTPLIILLQILIGLLSGAVIGLFIGWLVAYMNLVPMICTLALMQAFRGLAYIISGGGPVYGLPNGFAVLGSGRLVKTEGFKTGIIPCIVIFTFIVVIIFHLILTKTVFGRHVFATGSNPAVAHMCGVNTKRVTLMCHMICGITAGLAGVVAASKVNNGHPNTGDGYEMFAIAATVLGGTSLSGGSGSISRAMIGCAIIAVINNGMTLMEISAYWQKVVIGAIIILAVMLDEAQKKRANKT
ncbi:MAG: ABC transporter permease [Eubacterium sp.]|jgi:ribose transport system permease protein|nr:ABC transporter permease [Eubacterium sp.]